MTPVLLSEWAAVTKTQICVCIVLFVVFDLRSAAVNLQLFNTVLTHLSSRGRYTMHFLHCLVMCPVHMMEMCCIHVQLNLPVTCCLDTPTSSRHQSFESVKEEKWNVKDSSLRGCHKRLFLLYVCLWDDLVRILRNFLAKQQNRNQPHLRGRTRGWKRKEYGEVVEHS